MAIVTTPKTCHIGRTRLPSQDALLSYLRTSAQIRILLGTREGTFQAPRRIQCKGPRQVCCAPNVWDRCSENLGANWLPASRVAQLGLDLAALCAETARRAGKVEPTPP